jgi:hypothetical protein
VYPYATVDAQGKTLNGANQYTLTFAKGQTPPVNGVWSITMYEIDQGWWFVPNPLNKFTVSLRDKPKFNADGSLTLCFQNQSPGKDQEANWLPAPKGDFIPMIRMYWPKDKDPPGSGDSGARSNPSEPRPVTWASPVVPRAPAAVRGAARHAGRVLRADVHRG